MKYDDPERKAQDTQEEKSTEEQDLIIQHSIVADKGQEALRIDKFLVNRIEKASRSRIQNAARAGNILVNDKAVKPNYKVKPGDRISVVVPEAVPEFQLIAEDIPLDIVYEDAHLVVVNKRAGMVVHPGVGNYSGTLVNALLYHFRSLPDTSKENDRPGLVHRLDKNTSGIMVVARDEYAMMHLARQFFERSTDRKYYALVWGDFEEPEGTVTGNIIRDPRNRKRMAISTEEEIGKHAVTHYKVLQRFGYVTLIECKLETGRTHQIRVHMKHIGHPVFNDDLYDGNRIVKGTVYTKYKQFIDNCFKAMPRHALHAKSLGFEHPVSGERMHFDSELPDDFQAVLDKWMRYAGHLDDD